MPAAPNVNQVVLVGQLTRDPELRELPDGKAVCDLRLAVNDNRNDTPLFIDVAAFGREAENCSQFLVKGQQVAIEGRLVLRQWQGKDGEKHSKHQLHARHVSFGSARNHVPGGEKTER